MKEFVIPELEVIELSNKDVIVTSGECPNHNCPSKCGGVCGDCSIYGD